MQKILPFIFLILLVGNSFAQLQIFPIPKSNIDPKINSTKSTARTKAYQGLLPFWDDFSYASDIVIHPKEDYWQNGKTVWANNGMGIDPPSLGVATFDGTDALGKPYRSNENILDNGITDSLLSVPIRMDLVDVAKRGTVYLSYYFQFEGNGEPPDKGDQLILSIKNANGKWDIIKVIENDGSFKNDTFYSIIVPVAGDQYFYDKFQFRFQSFGRLSGPYDTWNLDYVYLNQGRSLTDTSYPDRAITSPLTSLFKDYQAIPYKHFLNNRAANLIYPSFNIYNLRQDLQQPMSFTSYDSIITYSGKVTTYVSHQLDSVHEIVPTLQALERKTIFLSKIPALENFIDDADSLKIKLKTVLNTTDNVLIIDKGDYDPIKYSPIDFRLNDITRAEYTLSDYYAYDDSTAEYGASLITPGSRVAYLFETVTVLPGSITHINFYFPKFGDETSQTMQLQILSDLTDSPNSLLYTETITIKHTKQNEFWHHKLTDSVGVTKQFYIALKQTNTNKISIGLDMNTDSGQKIFVNLNGAWTKNTEIKGSLMIRPVFTLKYKTIVSGLNELNGIEHQAYPNPSAGIFFIPSSCEHIHIYDMTGRLVEHEESRQGDQKRIDIKSPINGIYILKSFIQEEVYSQKIRVQQ